jgi:FtsP/CotA-like multicopper oxidase with cupredoxin domain
LAPIVVPYGSEVVLRVTNGLLSESISVHIHGLDKRGLWYTDGVSNVQQCPIQMASTYSYRFIADTAGTHWFHGHLMTDRGEGYFMHFSLRNPFIYH